MKSKKLIFKTTFFMVQNERDFADEAVKISAYLMAESARTAPKSKGIDDLEILYFGREEIEKIAKKMEEFVEEDENFKRDADSLRKAKGVLLIGLKGGKSLGINCGGCGFKNCSEFEKAKRIEVKFKGPNCAFKLVDLGIALGSAVKLSAIIGVDTRIMYRIALAVKKLGLTESDIAFAIPIAVEGKNPFFDRVKK